MNMTEPRCVECQVPTDGTLHCPVCDHGPLCGGCYDEHGQHACLMGEYN